MDGCDRFQGTAASGTRDAQRACDGLPVDRASCASSEFRHPVVRSVWLSLASLVAVSRNKSASENDKMSVNDSDSQESADSEQSKTKMSPPADGGSGSEASSLLPLVNIDAENYMLRGIGRPVLPAPETAATSNGDMEHQGATSGPATTQTNSVKKNCDTDIFWGWGSDVAGGDGVDCCARILSFHSILCSCEMSCCCKCVTLCSIDCHACFHNYCLRFFPNYLCQKDNDVLPPATLDYDKPVAEWTSSNVIEWMAAISLYTYSDVFRCKDIKGADLINLDRDKLIGMGIKDEFHQKAILTCIDELLKKPDEQPARNELEEYSSTGTNYAHNLTQHSFSTLERCDKCNKYLRGILHQGYICQDCGLVAHRTCAATGLPSCTHRPMDENSHFIQFKSFFGQGLCVQFKLSESPAPQVLISCTRELEKRARNNESLELYNLYCATPPSDQLQALVKRVEENPNNVELSDFSPVCIASVFKKYLRELPDPLIPVQWYDKFLEASKKRSDEECTSILRQLVEELPDHHKSTLRFIMGHLCRICQMEYARGNKSPPTVLVQVMCHIFLRPPWERIIQVVYNTQAHNRIVELLLLHCDWGEKLSEFASAPAIPPRKVSRVGSSAAYYSLLERDKEKITCQCHCRMQSGIGGDIKRKRTRAESLLDGKPDGTFLIRKSTHRDKYALSVMCNGTPNHCIINETNKGLGFTEPYNIYPTLKDLVLHYATNSLEIHNDLLNTVLAYPILACGENYIDNTSS
ncbi:hypothetical protein NQ318_016061 [Aromia moschata]|uniref:Phosphatidylinositol 3-kinase regulatory subunit alpha n=1 Tax=Aromia moschata TaxID=1265417 RepID=A0AAV8XRZ4_9CUCU|nr:hypothetical protein NQ318_016061 [Aromia moschata]